MTQPLNSQTDADGRTYVWPPTGEQFTSVTTILSVLSKPFLVKWAAKEAAQCAVAELELINKLCQAGRQVDAIDYVKTAHTRMTEKASDVGTDAHAWIEARIKGERPPEGGEPPHMKFFDAFCMVHKPDFKLCESTVYNRTEGYAGTMDFMAVIDGEWTIVDVKTGKSIYPEVALQLAAYSRGEFIGKDNRECEVPHVRKGAVLHIRPNGYKFVPVDISDEVWTSFRYIKEAYRWQRYLSRNVIQNGKR